MQRRAIMVLGFLGTAGCAAAPELPARAAPPAPPFIAPRTPIPPAEAMPFGSWRMPIRARCEGEYGLAVETGRLGDPDLVESSGIVASTTTDDVLWIHNDSGDTARVFAVRSDGSPVLRLVLDGVEAIDFEDIAAGPCPDHEGPCLWIADTGNNAHRRTDQALYAVREPDLRGSVSGVVPPRTIHAERVWRFPVAFPGAPVDGEAIAVSPTLDAIYLFEKVDRATARVFSYKAPFVADRRITLEAIAEIESPGIPIPLGRMITGAAFHTAGDRVLLRVYTGIYEYRFERGQSFAEIASLSPRTVTLGPLSEAQGEAVAYDAAGTGIWSVSEDVHHRPGQPLHHYACIR